LSLPTFAVVCTMPDDAVTPGTFAAADSADAAQKRDYVCEANFYIAEQALQKGSKDKAVDLFKRIVAECPRAFFEYQGAAAELKALGRGVAQ